MLMSNKVLRLPVNHGKCLFISLVEQWTLHLIGRPIKTGKKLNPRTACPMAEQISPLTFEGREFNPQMLGGLGVLNTPLVIVVNIDKSIFGYSFLGVFKTNIANILRNRYDLLVYCTVLVAHKIWSMIMVTYWICDYSSQAQNNL